jgi:hypothetical protein
MSAFIRNLAGDLLAVGAVTMVRPTVRYRRVAGTFGATRQDVATRRAEIVAADGAVEQGDGDLLDDEPIASWPLIGDARVNPACLSRVDASGVAYDRRGTALGQVENIFELMPPAPPAAAAGLGELPEAATTVAAEPSSSPRPPHESSDDAPQAERVVPLRRHRGAAALDTGTVQPSIA